MSKNNYPQAGLNDLPAGTIQKTVSSLMELREKGKPKDNEELKQRIDEYFNFCQNSSIRPGVETLALALGISRVTLFQWGRGVNCDAERTEIIEAARALINAFIEQCVLSGKISPPCGIFLLKNWMNYRDTVSIEESIPITATQKALTAAELPRLYEIDGDVEQE